ncbi:hypothetical protein [Methylobacterium tarhaniae]|uniref:hypothetical protein n=1 Tax=Methylobacterium tarhaniae TaxID=1187852 RepID=UPI003D046D81
MDTGKIDALLSGMLDELSSIEHERWSHWQRYMHSKGTIQADGSLVIPPELVAKWNEQINKNFYELSETEKNSDREQVRKYLPLIANKLKASL